ncbi:unnamed protein product, partial [Staurois parvus]
QLPYFLLHNDAPDHKTRLGFRGEKQQKKKNILNQWTADTVQEMDQRLRTQYRRWTRDCGHSTGDGPETADTVQEMDQRLRTQYRRWTRDCGHST